MLIHPNVPHLFPFKILYFVNIYDFLPVFSYRILSLQLKPRNNMREKNSRFNNFGNKYHFWTQFWTGVTTTQFSNRHTVL
jgi:hypothetical protein